MALQLLPALLPVQSRLTVHVEVKVAPLVLDPSSANAARSMDGVAVQRSTAHQAATLKLVRATARASLLQPHYHQMAHAVYRVVPHVLGLPSVRVVPSMAGVAIHRSTVDKAAKAYIDRLCTSAPQLS